MRKRKGLKIERFSLLFISGAILFFFESDLLAQTRIMPVGNSITWGKVNNQAPPAGTEGYRKPLHEKLTANGISTVFVGDSGSVDNRGYFADNARIGWFIHPDSVKGDMSAVLNTYQPDMVVLHIGTNDIGSGDPLGDYATPGTIMYQLYTLVTKIVDNPYVDDLLLCQVIPKLLTPGDEAETINFNNAMEIMLEELNTLQAAKVHLINMWVSFNANQSIYYNLDIDKVHPNATGYGAMANILFSHIRRILIPSVTDEFNRSPRVLNNDNGWVATSGIEIVSVGNGAAQFLTTGDYLWDNMAVWDSTRNLTTISMRFSESATADDIQYVGLAVGLNSFSATASGYLVYVRGGMIRAHTIVNGSASAGSEVVSWPIDPLQPGDVLKVSYRQAADANYFTYSVNNGPTQPIRDLNKLAGNGVDLWSGIMFRGNVGTVYNYPIDYFQVESQLEDVIAPGRIYDFDVFSTSNSSITLTWTAVGNDDYVGTAAAYDLRYSTNPIQTNSDFANANIISGLNTPQESGSPEIATITGLQPGTGYYFMIRAIDNWGNTIQNVNNMSDLVFAITASAGQRVEDFNRPTEPDGSIGDNWAIDASQYIIEYDSQTGEGEFANYQSDEGWGKAAVYLGQYNPSVVKMVWGTGATENGIAQGGFALMLNRPNTTADGYLLWVRIPLQKVLLYNIVNGLPTTFIDEVSYELRDVEGNIRYPQANDTMTVIMDWEDPDAHKFDVFVNGSAVASRALYDPLKRHDSLVKYAGLMLGRQYYSNNVTAFVTISEYTGTGAINVVQGNDQSGIVGTTLATPLKVEVRDQNQTPLPGVPVRFTVIEPEDAFVSAPTPPDNHIRIEAEWGILEGTYNEKSDDPGASGGKYIVAPAGDPESGTATYQFYVEKDTTYWLWGRLIATDFWNSVVSFKVDNVPAWTWHPLEGRYSSEWQWDRVNNQGGNPISMFLSKALHTITIKKLHNNVKIDKLLLSTSSSYVPTGKEYVEELFTDGNGQASTTLTLGTKVGNNQVKVTAYGTEDTELFEATGLPAAPTTMTKNNDGQSGVARDTLSLPFEVTLKDPYGNYTPDKVVTFSVKQGDGKLTATSDTTDANGKASTYLVLGSSSATNQVQANFSGYLGIPVIFTATTVSGLVDEVNGLPGVGSGVKHYVKDVLPNFLKVEVLDDQGQKMNNIGVTFQVVEGIASVGNRQPKYTSSQGIALDTLKMGSTASVVKVIASVGAIHDTVVVDSAFYVGAKLSYYSGDGGTASILDTLAFRLKARVFDSRNRAVAGHPVKFKTKEARTHGFTFPDGSDSVVVLTNLNGIAETNIQLGPIHGIYTDIVEAWSNDGFNPIPNSPVKYTLYAKSDASRLKKIQGDSLEWVVRERLPTKLKVQMVNIHDEGVPNQPVNWTIIGSGGYFEGTLPGTFNTTVMTDGNGYAQVSYTLGSTAGAYNNIIQASATDGTHPLYTGLGSQGTAPITFYISAKSSSADTIAPYQTATQLSGTVGKSLSQLVKVQVMDRLGNGAADGQVTFTVIEGGGVLNAAADTSVTVDIDNAAGIASVTWTLGTQAGTLNNVLEAKSENGLIELKGSPVYFYASGLADVVSPTVTSIQATSPVKAHEDSLCHITVTLKDAYGNPVSGKRVRITVDPDNSVFPKTQTTPPTDNSGKAYGSIVSLSAGEKKIHAYDFDDAITIETTATVLFTATGAANLQVQWGEGQTGNVGTILDDSLVIKVTDIYDNAVQYSPIQFDVISGGGQILESQPVASDANGLAYAHLVLGPNSGENIVRVTTDDLQGSPLYFSATGVMGQAVTMFSVSGHPQTGAAGEILPKPYVVGVKDINGKAVAGINILFEIESGVDGELVTPSPVSTDMYGHASAYYRMDTQSNVTSWVKATHPSLSGSPIRFRATSVAGNPRKIQYISGSPQYGYIGENIQDPLVVEVTDRFGNPVSGISVEFRIVSGNATIEGDISKTIVTNSSGRSSVVVTLGYTTGTVKVEARSSILEGSPVSFILHTQTLIASGIQKLEGEFSTGYPKSGDNQKGTVNTLFVDPLRIRVVDNYGNSVPGIQVFFSKDTGGGSIVESQPVVSDSNGVAQVHFMAGSVPGFSSVSAVVSNVVTFTLETVLNGNEPILNKDIIPSSRNVFEGEEMDAIPLVASDDDGDALTFQVANLFPPAGLMIEKQSATSAVLKWTPNYDQSGTYDIILRVIDNKGGSDESTVMIHVLNTNRPPEILSTIPRSSDTTVVAGQTVVFWVEAQDGDGDPLHYTWKVGGQVMGSDSPIFEYTINKYITGNQTVDVFVDDGIFPVSHRWKLNITTAIEIAEFAAVYYPETMSILIHWTGRGQINSSGFDVYRSHSENGHYVKINNTPVMDQENNTYRFIDQTVEAGYCYYYKLVITDSQGNEKEYGPVMITVPFPEKFELFQNYPNPFNPVTMIRYQIPERDHVVLTIYNMMGQKVLTLVDQDQGPGYYTVEWDGRDESNRETSTGIYIYQLQSTEQTVTRRMIKIK
ncbi:Ig-like domain-containing protein [bacterium]|nr:Ig-like domain-containing protein [bacterium]RQV94733.1 MAG: T9SS C-terminal target domain-containing protein [bacterium]